MSFRVVLFFKGNWLSVTIFQKFLKNIYIPGLYPATVWTIVQIHFCKFFEMQIESYREYHSEQLSSENKRQLSTYHNKMSLYKLAIVVMAYYVKQSDSSPQCQVCDIGPQSQLSKLHNLSIIKNDLISNCILWMYYSRLCAQWFPLILTGVNVQ